MGGLCLTEVPEARLQQFEFQEYYCRAKGSREEGGNDRFREQLL